MKDANARTKYDCLRDATTSNAIVRIWRQRIESSYMDAYVLALSPRFALLLPIRDRIDFDGFEVLRLRDIAEACASPRSGLYTRALRLKKLRRPRAPKLDLRDIQTLLAGIQRQYPAMVIHRELVTSDECEVGWIDSSSGHRYKLSSLTPDAMVEADNDVYRFDDVTRVQFDSSYENTLAAVASHVQNGTHAKTQAARRGKRRSRKATSLGRTPKAP